MKNIQIFTDVSELLLYLCCELTEEEKEFFSHILDFEPMDLLLIDDETVIARDTCNGDVFATNTAKEFIEYSYDYYNHYWEDYKEEAG